MLEDDIIKIRLYNQFMEIHRNGGFSSKMGSIDYWRECREYTGREFHKIKYGLEDISERIDE